MDPLLDTPMTAWGTPVMSPTNIPLNDNAGIVEVHFTWLINKTKALAPVITLEKHGAKNWYTERDSHYGPLGFKNNGWPMWKAIWGTGGAALGGIAYLGELQC